MVKDFNIKVEMEERWIPHFQSFLKYMERNGDIGHSSLVGFYADGDGDFRPKFEFDVNYDNVDSSHGGSVPVCEKFWDAG